MRSWLGEGLASLFHLEGKLARTLRDLPRPGRYAYRYLDGQRARYIHPLRLLLFSSLVCLATVGVVLDGGERPLPLPEDFVSDVGQNTAYNTGFLIGRTIRKLEGKDPRMTPVTPVSPDAHRLARSLRMRLDSIDMLEEVGSRELAHQLRDSLEHLTAGLSSSEAFRLMRDIDRLRARIVAHDHAEAVALRLEAAGLCHSPESLSAVDSFRRAFPEPDSVSLLSLHGESSKLIKVPPRLLATSSPAATVDSLGLSDPLSRLVTEKAVELYQTGSGGLISYLYANLSWGILLFTPFLALGYYICYDGRMPHYAQHLTYAASLLSVGLIALAVLTVGLALGAGWWLLWLIGLLYAGYIVASDTFFYGLPWWKALLKGFVIGTYGVLALIATMIVWVTVALIAL